MIKIKRLILPLLIMTLLIFSGQVEAKEIKPLFGIYKIISHESDEFLSQTWTQIYLTGDAAKAYPKLNKALAQYSKKLGEDAKTRDRKFHENALTLKQEAPQIFHTFSDKIDIIVRRADSIALSLMEECSDYTGGVHGMYGWFGVNFDTSTGKQLKISDICSDTTNLTNIIMTRLHEDYPQSPFENAQERIEKYIAEDTLNFTIDPDGISIYFNPYEIGSYAEGLFCAKLLFNEYPNIFNSKYAQVPKNYCQTLPLHYSNIVSFKNGMRNFITVTTNINEQCKVMTGGGTAEDRSGLRGLKQPVLVHLENGKNYLYIDGYVEDKGRRLHVYEIDDNKIELVWILPYTFKNLVGSPKYETWYIPTNPNSIEFDSLEPMGANGDLTSHFGGINADGSFSFG